MSAYSEEWEMICNLMEVLDELNPAQEEFVTKLYDNLDPYEPIENQLEGLPDSVEKQIKWIYSLHAKYVDMDDDEANSVWED